MSDIFAPKSSSGSPSTVTGKNFKIVGTASISHITKSGINITYSFFGDPDLRNYVSGSLITFSGCDNVLNDGKFEVALIDYDLNILMIENPDGVAQVGAGGHADISLVGYALNVNDVSESNLTSDPTQVKKIVGTSAVSLSVGGSNKSMRKKLFVQPVEISLGAKFFIGSSTVTSSGSTRGIELFDSVFYEFEDNSEWFIISDTIDQEFIVIEQ